jgi:hypothetical protein
MVSVLVMVIPVSHLFLQIDGLTIIDVMRLMAVSIKTNQINSNELEYCKLVDVTFYPGIPDI